MIGAFSATSIEEQTTSSDAGQYVQPQVWAKDKKSWRSVSDPDFPMYGGPGGEYVKVKNKCRTLEGEYLKVIDIYIIMMN